MHIKELVCPVSAERINERVTRCNAFFTILLVVAAVYFNSPLLLVFLIIDFYLRAFTTMRTSPLSCVSQQVVKLFGLKRKPTDKAPKIFAARMGFMMALAILVLFLFKLTTAALVIASILSFFALLELTIGFCAGCYIYSYLVLPLTRG